MSAKAIIKFAVEAIEYYVGDLGNVSKKHALDVSVTWPNGSDADEVQVVYSDSNSVTASSPVTYDLRGSLTGANGAALTFAVITGILIRNKSDTSGQNLLVGAGSNPWITWLLATGDGIKIPPGGSFFLSSPKDGFATTAGTGDILTIDSSSGTIEFDIILLGR